MYCPSCGAEIADNIRYCPDCGNAVANNTSKNGVIEEQSSSSSFAKKETLQFVLLGIFLILLIIGIARTLSLKVALCRKWIDVKSDEHYIDFNRNGSTQSAGEAYGKVVAELHGTWTLNSDKRLSERIKKAKLYVDGEYSDKLDVDYTYKFDYSINAIANDEYWYISGSGHLFYGGAEYKPNSMLLWAFDKYLLIVLSGIATIVLTIIIVRDLKKKR